MRGIRPSLDPPRVEHPRGEQDVCVFLAKWCSLEYSPLLIELASLRTHRSPLEDGPHTVLTSWGGAGVAG